MHLQLTRMQKCSLDSAQNPVCPPILSHRNLRFSARSPAGSPYQPPGQTAMAMPLQQVVVQIQGLSGSAADLASLHTLLKSQQVDKTLRAGAAGILEAATALHPTAHSLGLLYLL